MTKPKKEVKFQHRDGRRPSRTADTLDPPSSSSPSPSRNHGSPARNGTTITTKPELKRAESNNEGWTDDEKASISGFFFDPTLNHSSC